MLAERRRTSERALQARANPLLRFDVLSAGAVCLSGALTPEKSFTAGMTGRDGAQSWHTPDHASQSAECEGRWQMADGRINKILRSFTDTADKAGIARATLSKSSRRRRCAVLSINRNARTPISAVQQHPANRGPSAWPASSHSCVTTNSPAQPDHTCYDMCGSSSLAPREHHASPRPLSLRTKQTTTYNRQNMSISSLAGQLAE